MGIAVGNAKYKRDIYNKKYIIYGHLIGWGIFITFEFTTLYFMNIKFPSPIDTITHYLLNVFIFYFNALVVFPKCYRNKSIMQILLFAGILSEVVLYLCIGYLLNFSLERLHIYVGSPVEAFKRFLFGSAYRAVYFIMLSSGYWFAGYLLKSRSEIDELVQQQLISENDQLELQKKIISSENAFLKAQINPHFLFNSLSFIYNTVHKLSATAAEAVILLSDITRYSLRQVDANGQLPLNEEIEQINNLIELNQLRFNGELHLKFDLGFIAPAFTIPPLLLISFVENIFKYGKLDDAENPAVISIQEMDGVLQFRTTNVIQKRSGTVGYGVGIQNTQLRLNNIFPDKHRLNIIETGTTYTIELHIQMAQAEALYAG